MSPEDSADDSVEGVDGTSDEALDQDAAWAAIVAGYGDRVLGDPEDDPVEQDEPTPPAGPAASGTPGADADRLTIFDRPTYDARRAWRRDAGLRRPDRDTGRETGRPDEHAGRRAEDDSPPEHDESDERYVPPEPPPLPRPRGAKGFAWVGVIGVPLLFLVLTILDVRLVSGGGLLLLLWFIGSFGYLVGTMRDDPGDGWDDGARV
ncbi:hypothetical protein KLP28_02425 [Nocardioidaceae bacterium]|nr:hypothetical protein KLP28_02425 [Nocardioidaceae bacterium]